MSSTRENYEIASRNAAVSRQALLAVAEDYAVELIRTLYPAATGYTIELEDGQVTLTYVRVGDVVHEVPCWDDRETDDLNDIEDVLRDVYENEHELRRAEITL